MGIKEDYFVWGPANLIYYPEKLNEQYIQPGIYAALLNKENINHILLGDRQQYDLRRTIRTYANFRRILILSQPSLQSCVQIIDGSQPELSSAETPGIMVIAPYSKTDLIQTGEQSKIPPAVIFGAEPAHTWCYYYEKASLARQQKDWQAVTRLGDGALSKGYKPADPIEWLPFLQAYAIAGNQERLRELAPQVTADPFVARQACQVLAGTPGVSENIQEQVKSLYCVAK